MKMGDRPIAIQENAPKAWTASSPAGGLDFKR
jgi:hypothetical protein